MRCPRGRRSRWQARGRHPVAHGLVIGERVASSFRVIWNRRQSPSGPAEILVQYAAQLDRQVRPAGDTPGVCTPRELWELDHSPTIEVIADPEDIDYDAGSETARRQSKQVDMVANTLERWAIRDVGPHKLFLHFFEPPTEILGADATIVGLRTERTRLDGTGKAEGTGSCGTAGGCRVPSRRLPVPGPGRAAVRRARGCGAERGGLGADAHGAARYLPAVYVTGLDQARSGWSHRPYQGRCQ